MRPLQAVQIDHAKVDVIIVDGETGRELGRPWIALGIDAATRVVTGFHLTMAPPTRLSASLCLLHSVCDKTRWLEDRGIPFDWPVSGLPEAVLTDSNSFFGPRTFVRACKEVGIKNVWNSERDVKYGAHIEFLIGTRLGDVPLITDAALTDRSDREGCGRPHGERLSLDELECWLGAEIVGKYHRKRHPALRRSPIAAWRALASDASFRTPVDCVSFRLSFLPEEECDLHVDGVSLLGQTFWSRALADDFEADRAKLTVKYDPRDLSRIFVKRPSGRFVKAFNASEEQQSPNPGETADAETLIANSTPDLSIADRLVTRMATNREPELRPNTRQSQALALAASADVLDWREDAATRVDSRDSAETFFDLSDGAAHACARKCVSSCPFQFVKR